MEADGTGISMRKARQNITMKPFVKEHESFDQKLDRLKRAFFKRLAERVVDCRRSHLATTAKGGNEFSDNSPTANGG